MEKAEGEGIPGGTLVSYSGALALPCGPQRELGAGQTGASQSSG